MDNTSPMVPLPGLFSTTRLFTLAQWSQNKTADQARGTETNMEFSLVGAPALDGEFLNHDEIQN